MIHMVSISLWLNPDMYGRLQAEKRQYDCITYVHRVSFISASCQRQRAEWKCATTFWHSFEKKQQISYRWK